MGIAMDSKLKISKEDYKFFSSLPTSEKLMFLYDMVCTDYYQEIEQQPNIIEHWHKLVSSTILNDTDSNVLVINKLIVVNSDSYSFLHKTVSDMFEMGYILRSLPLEGLSRYVFHQQKYCKVYYLVGITDSICLN